MTDYNDGNWHAWIGESLKPAAIHDKSVVEYVWHDENTNKCGKCERVAGRDERDVGPAWGNMLKFRVTKEHREPREFWLVGCYWFQSKEDAKKWHGCHTPAREITHVREVLK